MVIAFCVAVTTSRKISGRRGRNDVIGMPVVQEPTAPVCIPACLIARRYTKVKPRRVWTASEARSVGHRDGIRALHVYRGNKYPVAFAGTNVQRALLMERLATIVLYVE